ncbi:MAG: 4Fe-4S dicluster domain-containing protein [Candidatus Thermoplasmatota archaeon]|nr:4Fe-4S dicluster domain-containing protein [Candidatus Thermoplasmatota archaeon]
MFATISILTGIGAACGFLIFIMSKILPKEDETLAKTGVLAEILPGMNCGACGQPGCFAYAQQVAKDKEFILNTPCMTLLQDGEALKQLEEILDISLDTSGMAKIAVIHCYGNSENIFDYDGIRSCKAAAQIGAGYKKCPYGCLGLGDCAAVCLQDAITVDPETDITKVDPEKCIGCGLCIVECPHGLIELIPRDMPHYLGCSYTYKKKIPGREWCEMGCIHCRKCIKACETDAVTWDKDRNLPTFDMEKCTASPESIEACPNNVIIPISTTPPAVSECH